MEPKEALAKQATKLIKIWGPVYVGTASADFSVIKLSNHPGWAVTGHHNDILNYVSPEEFEVDNPSDVTVGMIGRQKRDEDAKSLKIVHIEDKRRITM